MLARRTLQALVRRPLSIMASSTASSTTTSNPPSQTPMADIMREKITTHLHPTHLEIHNDSHLHTHHKAMAGSTSQETHFRVVITSEAFAGKMQTARHKMVYALLKEEMAREGGIHALQLKTRTGEEVGRVEGGG